MIPVWFNVTIGASPVALDVSGRRVSKILVQSAPGNSGNIKIGSAPDMTADATTPGTWLAPGTGTNPDGSPKPGDSWSVESHEDRLNVFAGKYYIHGTNAGDVAAVCLHNAA